MHFGPLRGADETLRTFRLRRARYAMRWLVGLGAPLVAMVAAGVRVQGSSAQGIVLFLYFALSIGVGIALLATASYLLGAWWAGVSTATTSTVRLLLGTVVFLPISCGALYFFTRGLINLEVPLLLAKRGPPFVAWSTSPISFIVNMGILGGLAVGIPVFLVRRYRRGAT